MAETKYEKLLTALKWNIPRPLSELYCKVTGAIELFFMCVQLKVVLLFILLLSVSPTICTCIDTFTMSNIVLNTMDLHQYV